MNKAQRDDGIDFTVLHGLYLVYESNLGPLKTTMYDSRANGFRDIRICLTVGQQILS